jgi:predicted DNA-binding transcriptional regulator AlpA
MDEISTNKLTQTYIQYLCEEFLELRKKLNYICNQLEALQNAIPTPAKDNKLISDEELCEWLDVSKTTLWRYEKAGKIRPMKIGRTKMYDLDEVREAFARQ